MAECGSISSRPAGLAALSDTSVVRSTPTAAGTTGRSSSCGPPAAAFSPRDGWAAAAWSGRASGYGQLRVDLLLVGRRDTTARDGSGLVVRRGRDAEQMHEAPLALRRHR